MDEKKLTLETYTLYLKHSILETGSVAYMINEMMDRMKHEVLCRFER